MGTIGIIGAMDVEIEGILAQMTDSTIEKSGSFVFTTGRLGGKDIVVVKCRIGKVNAAMCATALLAKYDVAAVINLGVAGAAADVLNIGDVVISKDLVQHDVDAQPYYAPGQVPGMAIRFAANAALAALAETSCRRVFAGLDNKAYVATVATGDVFVHHRDIKERIAANFGAYCIEMEGAAIAHVCQLMDIPFVAIRAISDKAEGGANVDFEQFVVTSAAFSAKIVVDMMENL